MSALDLAALIAIVAMAVIQVRKRPHGIRPFAMASVPFAGLLMVALSVTLWWAAFNIAPWDTRAIIAAGIAQVILCGATAIYVAISLFRAFKGKE